jgi:hypothetical protein
MSIFVFLMGSFMCHPESGPHLFGFIQAIHSIEFLLVH